VADIKDPSPGGVPSWRQARPLVIFGAVVLVTAVLYAARAVLVPVALAVLLAFLLNPVVAALDRLVGRGLAVLLVVVLAFSALGGIGWVLWWEGTSLAHELPKYRLNILRRVDQLRGATKGGAYERLTRTAKDVMSEIDGEAEPRARVVVGERGGWLGSRVPSAIAPVMETLAVAALVVALVVFMLARREEMRARVISLAGGHRLPIATKAIDEAFDRIGTYLLSLSVINASLGVAVGIGLGLIGVPYAVLWGFLTAILRFIPYVGVWVAAVPAVALSLAVFSGWAEPLLVIALFAVLEPCVAFVVEPLVYGQRIGVSDVGFLVAVAFWTWLWGPVGLLLAAPLTACLVVVGKHVPELEFLAVLLGEESDVPPDLRYYDRLLAGDQDGAADVAEEYAQTHSPTETYDHMLLPALSYARRDRAQERIADDDAALVVRATREVVEGLAPPVAVQAGETPRQWVVGCPARDELDALALTMLGHLLDPAAWEVRVVSPDMLAVEVGTLVEERPPAALFVTALAPGGLANARYVVKRLRGGPCGGSRIVIGRFGAPGLVERDLGRLRAAGADEVTTSLADARDRLAALAAAGTRAAA
jgi:predicted PurR-regulated permease PerM